MRCATTRCSPNLLALVLLGVIEVGSARAADPTAPPSQDKDIADMSLEELVNLRVSPFDVSANLDQGYRASSSVSGSRFDTPISQLPFAIQAFTKTFIDDQKPVTIIDVARYSPSVTYRSNDFNEGNANLAIRGFAISATVGNIQILRDGFHGPSVFDFTNIDRLEIVKGPASFLYGQVAPGGIVNIITKSPQARLAATGRVSYGSYGEYRLDLDVTGPLAKRLFFRVASSYDQDMHYWKPYDAHSTNVSPSLLWQPYEWLSLSAKLESFRKVESPQVMQKPGYPRQTGVVPTPSDPNRDGVDVPGLPDDWNSMSDSDFRNSDTTSLNLAIDLRASEHWDLRACYAHLEYKVDAVFSGNLGMSADFPFIQGRRVRRTTYSNRGDTFEVDATGAYRFPFMSLRLLLGAQYITRSFDNASAQAPNDPSVGPIASPLPNWDLQDPSTWNRSSLPSSTLTSNKVDQTTTYRDKALYGGATLGFFDDRLLVLAGVRLTVTESQLVDNLTSIAGHEFAARKYTPQFGALYKLPLGLSLFATYAESFVPGSQILRVRGVPTTPAAPTDGRGVDVGVKAELLSGRLSGSVTAFQVWNNNIVNDIAELDPSTGVQVFTYVQSGGQRSRGIEVDATLTPVANWQTYLSYSFNDAKIIELSGNDAAILATGPSAPGYKEVLLFHNAPLQMSAPHLANIWSRYTFTWRFLEGLALSAGANLIVDQTLLPDTPKDAHQTYVLVNATVGYSWQQKGRKMAVDLMGKNLADQHYRPSQSSRSRPREFRLSFSIALE